MRTRLGTVNRLCARVLLAVALAVSSQAAIAQTKFVFANASPYDTLDPHMVLDSSRIASRINLYDGLLRWLDNPAKLEAWLAEAFTVSPDSLTYTFELRKGIKFHDGTELKASDVVYSMERILALKQGAASLFAPLIAPGATKAAGDHTVEFNLIRPSPIFLAILPEVHVVNAALVKKNEVNNDWGNAWLAKNDAGSGSYKLTRFDPAAGFQAERFKEHWNPKWGAKPIDEIEFKSVVDSDSRTMALINGDVHAIGGYLAPDHLKRARDAPILKVQEAESMRLIHAIVHNGRAPLNDINFRKALSHAFDYEGYNKTILAGTGVRNPVPLPNSIWGAPKGVKGFAYDLEAAKDHLAKLKEPPREITIGAVAGDAQSELAAALFQGSLDKLGLKTKRVAEPWPVVAARMRDEKQMYDVLFLWKSASYADPNNWIGEMYDCDQFGARNNSWYCNRDVDILLKDALSTTDQDARRKAYEKASVMVMEDAAGIFISTTKWLAPINTKVTGIRYSPVGEGQEMRWASMEP